jgi:hypothetical protein
MCRESHQVLQRRAPLVRTPVVSRLRRGRCGHRYGLTNKQKTEVYVTCASAAAAQTVQDGALYIETLSSSASVTVVEAAAVPDGCSVSVVNELCTVFILLKGTSTRHSPPSLPTDRCFALTRAAGWVQAFWTRSRSSRSSTSVRRRCVLRENPNSTRVVVRSGWHTVGGTTQ